jgi:para-nitrobenzyl esterase
MSLNRAQTQSGLVAGQAIPGKDLTVFRGIPFAAPPVGALRWQAPQPAPAWAGVLQADQFRPAAWQTYAAKGSFYDKEWNNGPFERSEDCLYLNVWTPAHSAGEKLPVAVWIYGGGFMTGYAHENEFDGEAISSRGVVYVSINYRLNALGYLAHPDLERETGHSGNYGLLDQIAALRWVHDNIDAFGGDPGNVLVFGQSAGAGSTQCLACSPLTRGLMHKAVIHSGSGYSKLVNPRTMPEIYAFSQQFIEFCGYRSPLEMRDVPAEKLIGQFGRFFGKYMFENPPEDPAVPMLPFAPCIDGYALLDDFIGTVDRGIHNDVRFILGSAREDIPGSVPVMQTSVNMHEGMLRWALKDEAQRRQPDYVYFFTRALPGDDSGSFHSCDLWYIHGTLPRCWRPFEETDYQLSSTMITYWTNFMKTGDPNTANLPAWRPYTAGDPAIMIFGDQTGLGEARFNMNLDVANTARFRLVGER